MNDLLKIDKFQRYLHWSKMWFCKQIMYLY